jgi:hypothetical protein
MTGTRLASALAILAATSLPHSALAATASDAGGTAPGSLVAAAFAALLAVAGWRCARLLRRALAHAPARAPRRRRRS